jgi:Zn-dependent protease/Tfp pilus assembly protein PilF
MLGQTKGTVRLFEVAGIAVLVHWWWLPVAVLEITVRAKAYPSLAWNVAEYLALFGIVLLHELGHAFACRSVGGTADRVVLWPLGGIAQIVPPPRPGAYLWSVAAGPLVNVLLVPVTVAAVVVTHTAPAGPFARFCFGMMLLNVALLVFNLLPIYPLDGGQILHALLWFILGRSRSLAVCSVIGLLGAAGLFLLALSSGDYLWIGLAVFLGLQALAGFGRARTMVWLQPALEEMHRAREQVRQGDCVAAVAAADRALELMPEGNPARADAHACRALALARGGHHEAAVKDYDEAIRLFPKGVPFHVNRGLSLAHLGRYAQAEEDYFHALDLDPRQTTALNNLAWLRATCPDPDFRDGPQAIEWAEQACRLSRWKVPSHLGTLAAAYAEAGDFAEAVAWQQKAQADPAYEKQHGEGARQRIQLYEARTPYRELPDA